MTDMTETKTTAPETLTVIWTDMDEIDTPSTVGAYTRKTSVHTPKNIGFKRIEYTRADLSQAAIAAAMMGAVKPLKWVEGNIDSNGKKGDTYYARSMVDFSPIAIHKHPRGWWLNKNSITYRTIELAKAAAQKIETARILSAISIPTDATAALEAVKAQVRDEALNECLVLSMEHDSRYGDGAESELTAEIRELKGKREQQMTNLQDYTDEDLLRELVRRRGIMDAPRSRTMHQYEVLLGIGKDNHCYITFTDNSDVEALKRNNKA